MNVFLVDDGKCIAWYEFKLFVFVCIERFHSNKNVCKQKFSYESKVLQGESAIFLFLFVFL